MLRQKLLGNITLDFKVMLYCEDVEYYLSISLVNIQTSSQTRL